MIPAERMTVGVVGRGASSPQVRWRGEAVRDNHLPRPRCGGQVSQVRRATRGQRGVAGEAAAVVSGGASCCMACEFSPEGGRQVCEGVWDERVIRGREKYINT